MKLSNTIKLLNIINVQFFRNVSSTSVCCIKHAASKKPKLSEKQLQRVFKDEKRIVLIAGKGGDGMSCFLRDKVTEYGGPNGGNGGRGGDIIFVCDKSVKCLQNIESQYIAENGKSGGSKDLDGRNGKSLYVHLPVGTLVRCDISNEIIADLCKDGDSYLMCAGGSGGKGNSFFVSSVNTTPEECTPGLPGEKQRVGVELRTLAHAGLIGFPNAGKSTLLRSLTRAKPAIAAYPFTTLVPHVGVLHFEDFTQVIVADTPGIIAGAHMNRGLGIRFLKHIERCRFLLFVIDLSSNPYEEFIQLHYELEQFDNSLTERPGIVLANKIDLPEAKNSYVQFKEKVESLDLGLEVLPVSAKLGHFLEEVILKIRYLYDTDIVQRKNYGKTIALEW